MLLLSHLRDLFGKEGSDKLRTRDVLEYLVSHRDDGPWPQWWGRDVLDGNGHSAASQLAKKLKPYGIRPNKHRDGETTLRGYARSDFEDAWGRYLPPLDPGTSGTKEPTAGEAAAESALRSTVPLVPTPEGGQANPEEQEGEWTDFPDGGPCEECGERAIMRDPAGRVLHVNCSLVVAS